MNNDYIFVVCVRDNPNEESRKIGLKRLFMPIIVPLDNIIDKEKITEKEALIRFGYDEEALQALSKSLIKTNSNRDLNETVMWYTFYNEKGEKESGYDTVLVEEK